MKWQIESITRTDLARFFVWTGGGFVRDALCADLPNLQKRCATIRLSRGFLEGQRLCCSTFASSAHSSPQNLSALRAYYHQLGQRHKKYGVKAEHYLLFRAALLETFHHYLGPRFTPEMQQAWDEAIEMISAQMLEGADMLPVQEEGEFR
jgi:hypothetical protein